MIQFLRPIVSVCSVTLILGCQLQSDSKSTLADQSAEQLDRIRDLEHTLLRMSDDQLFEAGITAVDRGRWSIAWSTNSDADTSAVIDALARVKLHPFGSAAHGRVGWYIEKEDFFTAQAALKRSEDVRRLGITIVEPSVAILSDGNNDEP